MEVVFFVEALAPLFVFKGASETKFVAYCK